MDNGWIQNQIAIYMTNKKLVEFNDKLKPAPIEYYGHIHAQGEKLEDGSRPRSCIKGNTVFVNINDYDFFSLMVQTCRFIQAWELTNGPKQIREAKQRIAQQQAARTES